MLMPNYPHQIHTLFILRQDFPLCSYIYFGVILLLPIVSYGAIVPWFDLCCWLYRVWFCDMLLGFYLTRYLLYLCPTYWYGPWDMIVEPLVHWHRTVPVKQRCDVGSLTLADFCHRSCVDFEMATCLCWSVLLAWLVPIGDGCLVLFDLSGTCP
jgi:hypothetical protein